MDNDTFHPHKEVIKAWLEDARIEFRPNSKMDWRELETYSDVKILPAFVKEWQYRIKGNDIHVLRVFETKNGNVVVSRTLQRSTGIITKNLENNSSFKRWLTDWIEYDD